MELKNETKGVIVLPNNQILHPGKSAPVDDKVTKQVNVKGAIDRGHLSVVADKKKASAQ